MYKGGKPESVRDVLTLYTPKACPYFLLPFNPTPHRSNKRDGTLLC